MKNFVVSRNVFVHVRHFIMNRKNRKERLLAGCHNLERIAIEDGNFQELESLNLMDGLTHVKEIVLGPMACSLCNALTIQG